MEKVTFTTVDGHKKQGLADQGHKFHGHRRSVQCKSRSWQLPTLVYSDLQDRRWPRHFEDLISQARTIRPPVADQLPPKNP